MAFSEVREYQDGDEIRTIDWNVTARFNHPFVKVFEEEREMTVVLVVDVSGSQAFGSHTQTKQAITTEICAVLAFSALQNNDKVGVIFFSDRVEKFIPPAKGKSHVLRIIRELLDFQPKGKGTQIDMAFKYLSSVIKKRANVFVLSDFIDEDFLSSLSIANRKHEVVALRVKDQIEAELPDTALVPLEDAETGQVKWMDTSSKAFQKLYKVESLKKDASLKTTFQKAGVDFATILTDRNYVPQLVQLFKKRENRR